MEINYPEENSGHKNSFEIGKEFEDFVCIQLAKDGIILQNINSKKFQFGTGENLQGFEIKCDNVHTRTGRLSIEIAEKTNAMNKNYINSGIYRGDNSWLYIQGNYDLFFIFSITMLKLLHNRKVYEEKEMATLKSFYLPHSDCFKFCCKFYDFKRR